LRTAALVTVDASHLAIDCGPDFRQQMLRAGIGDLDAILLTHSHNDHIIGLDDIRPFNFRSGLPMAIYGQAGVLDELPRRFPYAFETANRYPGVPSLRTHPIYDHEPLFWKDRPIYPIAVKHGELPVLGFRFGNLAYVTDVNFIPESSMSLLEDLDFFILGVLQPEPHHAHYHLEQGLEVIARLRPRQSFLVHCNHRMGLTAETNLRLPSGVALAFDGQYLDVNW